MAGVEPTFERLNGQDPVAFIFSANLARREMTKGQKAMATAFMYPEAETTARGRKSNAGTLLVSQSVSASLLSQARAVMRHSRAKAEAVISGLLPLDTALAEVRAEQTSLESAETKTERLRVNAPNLADDVLARTMRLDEASAFRARIGRLAGARVLSTRNARAASGKPVKT